MGFMMRSFEEGARLFQAIAATEIMKDPAAKSRIHKYLMKNDKLYASHVNKSATKTADDFLILKFLIEKPLGQYGREGRAPFQNQWLAVTLMPFATYPMQMIGNTAELIGSGPEGKKAAAYAMSSLFMLSGFWALPGAEDLRKMLELVLGTALEEDIDLELELRRMLGEFSHEGGGHASVMMNEGALNAFTNLDIADRNKLTTPGLTTILDWMKGQGDPMDILGVQSSIVELPIETYFKYQETGDMVASFVSEGFPLVAVQNFGKAVYEYPKYGKA
jgi:hypothetical protein